MWKLQCNNKSWTISEYVKTFMDVVNSKYLLLILMGWACLTIYNTVQRSNKLKATSCGSRTILILRAWNLAKEGPAIRWKRWVWCWGRASWQWPQNHFCVSEWNMQDISSWSTRDLTPLVWMGWFPYCTALTMMIIVSCTASRSRRTHLASLSDLLTVPWCSAGLLSSAAFPFNVVNNIHHQDFWLYHAQ